MYDYLNYYISKKQQIYSIVNLYYLDKFPKTYFNRKKLAGWADIFVFYHYLYAQWCILRLAKHSALLT
jgi:hypothetical protein